MPQYEDKILGTVTLNESYRAQNVSIKINRRDGAVTLTYPLGFNQARAIKFLEEKRERILKIRERQSSLREQNPAASSYDEAQLRTAAREYLPGQIAKISSQINMPFNKLSIRATRSRWGSCSSKNNISLSIFLMILPKHLIDFVIIHELCHTIHHNHSPKFHALLNHICSGREKEFDKELKGYSIR